MGIANPCHRLIAAAVESNVRGMTGPDLVRNPRRSPWGHGLQAAQQRLTAAEIQHAVECAQQCVDLVRADERGTAKLASFYARQLDHSTLMMRIEPDQGSSISSKRGRPSRFSASRRHSRLANYPSRPAGLIRGSTLRAEGRGRVDESGLPRPLGAKHADKLIATSSQRNVGEDCSPTERQRAVSEFSERSTTPGQRRSVLPLPSPGRLCRLARSR
jgi:hypothetical protein